MTFSRNTSNVTSQAQKLLNTRQQRQRGHVLPRTPVIDLHSLGRLRSAHVLALCGFSHSTLYSRMKSGKFPYPDGNDGLNFWNTSTIKCYLETVINQGGA